MEEVFGWEMLQNFHNNISVVKPNKYFQLQFNVFLRFCFRIFRLIKRTVVKMQFFTYFNACCAIKKLAYLYFAKR